MLRKGQQVETLTKKAGQTSRSGVVIDIRGDEFVTIEWSDGRVTTMSASAVVPVSKQQAASRER